MGKKTITIVTTQSSFGGVSIGSYAEKGWLIENIIQVSIDGGEVSIICDCVSSNQDLPQVKA
jgi:hypothetical protein